MSSKTLIDSQNSFRKSHTISRNSGSKTQRDMSSSNQGNSVSYMGHNIQQQINNSSNSNQGRVNVNQGYPSSQLQYQASAINQQQLRGGRNNSENRHSTTQMNASSLNNNSSSIINTSSSSIKTSQILRNNSNFSATPQKKKDTVPMYTNESGGGKINHSTSFNQNYSQIQYQNQKYVGSNSRNGAISSGMKPQQTTSASSSSQKLFNQNSIFTNNFAKENIGYCIHKHSVSSTNINNNKIQNSFNGISGQNYCANNSESNQQNINNFCNLINNNSNNNSNLTNSQNNQNGLYQVQNQNNYNNNNNSTSLSPNQRTLYQNILNSSWKVNTLYEQTPKKIDELCNINNNNNSCNGVLVNNNNFNQNSNGNSNSKFLNNSSQSYSKNSSRQQQPYIQENSFQILMNTNDKTNGQDLSPLNTSTNHVNNRLNTSTSSSSKTQQNEEVKRLKMEIEQFKNREIKYLVRIATLEKETKKLSEQLEKSELTHKEISQENQKLRKINGFNNNSNNMSQPGNSIEKNIILNTALIQNNTNLTQSIDEIQRGIRQKTEPIDFTQQNSNSQINQLNNGIFCYCGQNTFSNSLGMNSGNKQGVTSLSSSNSSSNNKYKLKYTQIRNQHKEILKNYIDAEKENKEIKSESQIIKQLYFDKVCTKAEPSQQDNNITLGDIKCNILSNNSNQTSSILLQCLDNNISDKIPSFMKVLGIGQSIQN